jgi:hypothetical protein
MHAILWLEKPEGGTTRKDNIRMELREIGWGNVDWIHLARWRAVVKTVTNFRVT